MQTSQNVNKNETESSDKLAKARAVDRRLRRIGAVFASLAVLAAVASFVIGHLDDSRFPVGDVGTGTRLLGHVAPAASAGRAGLVERRRLEEERITAARRAAAEKYVVSVERESSAFRRRVARLADCEFGALHDKVAPIVDGFGYLKCADLIRCRGLDMMHANGRDDRLEKALEEEFGGSFYQPLVDARGRVADLLREYDARLVKCADAYGAEIDSIPGWDMSLGAVPQSLVDEARSMEELLASKAFQNGIVHAGLSLDAGWMLTFIKRCCVGKVVGSAANGAVSKVTGGTAAAAADGVMPIGDILAVGSLIWTACDINGIVKDVQSELSTELVKTIDEQHAEIVKAVLSEGEMLRASYKSLAGSEISDVNGCLKSQKVTANMLK